MGQRSVSTRRRSQRGNAMLESAFVIIPLFAILTATIDFSMALFIRNSLVFAVREGVRYGVTGQTGAGGNGCQDASVKYIVQQNAMGVLNGSAGLAKIQIKFYDQNLGDVTAAANSNAAGNIMRVSVTGVPWLWMLSKVWENVDMNRPTAPQHYDSLTMSAASSDIVEAPPGGIPPCR